MSASQIRARADRAGSPGTSCGLVMASAKLILLVWAKPATYSWARSPIPRLCKCGWRRGVTASAGVAATRSGVGAQPAAGWGRAGGDRRGVDFPATGEQEMTVAMVYAENAAAGNWILGLDAFEANYPDQMDVQVFVRKAEGVPSAEALAAVDAAFRALARGEVRVPAPMNVEFPEVHGELHVKGAYLHGASTFVFKVATGFYGNVQLGLPTGAGFVMIFDLETGFPRAILHDNGYLTDLRTALAGAEAAGRRPGCRLHSSYWPAKLCWLRKTEPDTVARTARWLSFAEYALGRLCAAHADAVTSCMASGNGACASNG